VKHKTQLDIVHLCVNNILNEYKSREIDLVKKELQVVFKEQADIITDNKILTSSAKTIKQKKKSIRSDILKIKKNRAKIREELLINEKKYKQITEKRKNREELHTFLVDMENLCQTVQAQKKRSLSTPDFSTNSINLPAIMFSVCSNQHNLERLQHLNTNLEACSAAIDKLAKK